MTALANKIAVVTGASSGIGKAMALGLAAQGAVVCLLGRRPDELEAVAKQARKHSAKAHCYRADLERDDDIRDIAARLEREMPGVDVLVHSAGTIAHGSVESAPVKDFDCQYRTNVRAPYALTQALLPMLRSHQGQVVFMNSSVGLRAPAGVGQYAATKHALKAMADSLRDEVNAHGVRVLSVYLGRTATPMQAAVHEMEGREYHPERLMQPEDVVTLVLSALTLPRTAEVTDISIRPMQKLPDALATG